MVHGTFRGDRHGDGETPEPPNGTPKPPLQLGPMAQAEWDRMVKRLEASETLSLVDDAALYQYVQLFAETEAVATEHERTAARAELLEDRICKELSGRDLVQAVTEIVKLEQVLSKQQTQLRQGHMAIRQYLVEFGLTPSARSRVKVLSKEKDATQQPTSALARLQAQGRTLRAVK